MYKYAEIYGGRVRDLRESNLSFTEFCSIWDPTSFWLDVTGVEEIGIGWIIKSNVEVGTYFEEPAPTYTEETVESKRAGKMEILDKLFKDTLESAYIMSSLGFYANAGTRAKGDIDGLITQMEAENIDQKIFMDYDNVAQQVSLEELKTLQLEIIKNGESVYHQKWAIRNAIQMAETIEAVESIEVDIRMYNFIYNCFIGDEPVDDSIVETPTEE